MSREQRLQVDLLISQATKRSSDDLKIASQRLHGPEAEKAASFHLSCLKTLNISVTVPSQGRPAFLPQAVALYGEVRSKGLGKI